MTRIYIQEEKKRDFSCANDIILKIHKRVNEERELLHYYVKIFHNQNPARDFTFEYVEGNLIVTRGAVSKSEFELLVRCIQVLELSDSFPE